MHVACLNHIGTILLDLHKPLYLVGAGDIGTGDSTLNVKLMEIFHVAATCEVVVRYVDSRCRK